MIELALAAMLFVDNGAEHSISDPQLLCSFKLGMPLIEYSSIRTESDREQFTKLAFCAKGQLEAAERIALNEFSMLMDAFSRDKTAEEREKLLSDIKMQCASRYTIQPGERAVVDWQLTELCVEAKIK